MQVINNPVLHKKLRLNVTINLALGVVENNMSRLFCKTLYTDLYICAALE